MNFLIAVIVQSYNKVIKNKEAFDYQQRASMIQEREGYFSSEHLQSKTYFPKIIVVRKLKEQEASQSNNANEIRLKNQFRALSQKLMEGIQK